MRKFHMLIVDDDAGIREDLEEFFQERGYAVCSAGLPSEAFTLLEERTIDLVLLDLKMPEMDGLQMLEQLKRSFSAIEVIMMTGHGDTRSIVKAMRLGAFDFFTKPFGMVELQAAIERTNKFLALQQQLEDATRGYAFVVRELQKRLAQPIVGKSQAIGTVLKLMAKVAQSDETSVLVRGESGTGKELVARGIHALSRRREHYFCEMNCSAIPESLFESELFGHKKGAFTGASSERIGTLEAAHQGTLFLDEIGDIPLTYQAKLLKTLEEKKIKALGSNTERAVDVRIISATNQPLEKLVEGQRFRLDLLHRINTFEISLLPLRERPEDIPLLLEHFIASFAKKLRKAPLTVDGEAIEALQGYHFPGNVRELRNLVERAVILCEGVRLDLSHFCIPDSSCHCAAPLSPATGDILDLEELTRRAISAAMQRTDDNKSEAAKLLGISRHALSRKLGKYSC